MQQSVVAANTTAQKIGSKVTGTFISFTSSFDLSLLFICLFLFFFLNCQGLLSVTCESMNTKY